MATLTAPRLGAHAISAALSKTGLTDTSFVEECFMGNVVSAGMSIVISLPHANFTFMILYILGIGQAPTRQAVIYSGLHLDVPSTTVNKVCASGMKAVMFASLSISSGYRSAVIAGGMESMSNIPYYLPGARTGYRLGNQTVVDGLINDGLWDVYNNQHMGNCGELCSVKYSISRKDQDEFAILSYQRAAAAWSSGVMASEVSPISVETKKGSPPTVVSVDEEFSGFKPDKMATLRCVPIKLPCYLLYFLCFLPVLLLRRMGR